MRLPSRAAKLLVAGYNPTMPNYFKTLRFWWVDLVICYGVACTITPADPMSAIVVFVPTFVVWMTIRYLLARRYRVRS